MNTQIPEGNIIGREEVRTTLSVLWPEEEVGAWLSTLHSGHQFPAVGFVDEFIDFLIATPKKDLATLSTLPELHPRLLARMEEHGSKGEPGIAEARQILQDTGSVVLNHTTYYLEKDQVVAVQVTLIHNTNGAMVQSPIMKGKDWPRLRLRLLAFVERFLSDVNHESVYKMSTEAYGIPDSEDSPSLPVVSPPSLPVLAAPGRGIDFPGGVFEGSDKYITQYTELMGSPPSESEVGAYLGLGVQLCVISGMPNEEAKQEQISWLLKRARDPKLKKLPALRELADLARRLPKQTHRLELAILSGAFPKIARASAGVESVRITRYNREVSDTLVINVDHLDEGETLDSSLSDWKCSLQNEGYLLID